MPGGGRVLGVDYGRRRVGIAVSDPLGVIARPLKVLARTASLAAEVGRTAAELGAGTVVVGLPLTLRGEKGGMALEVEAFVDELRRACGLEVVTVDERFTSATAADTMIEMGVPMKKRREKGRIDAMAAALILQDFLDNRPGSTGSTGSI